MSNEAENKTSVVTGLEHATNRREAEYDLVSALLTAAEFRTDEEEITEVEIRRKEVFLFKVHLHPISDSDVRLARKKATTYMPNPTNKKLPKIEKEYNSTLFNSWLIYLATTPEDQQKIWGQKAVMEKFNLSLPVESIDILLRVGEKTKMLDTIGDISGMDDEDMEAPDLEDYAGE